MEIKRLLNNAEWAEFIGAASITLALKYGPNPPKQYPCIGIRTPAHPDDGPGAPSHVSYVCQADIDALSRILDTGQTAQIPNPLVLILRR